MNNHRTAQRKPVKYLEIKILIATLSVAITIGMWNLLAGKAYQEVSPQSPLTAPPPRAQGDGSENALPVPTLVPLIDVSGGDQAGTTMIQTSQDPVEQATSLRSVALPTQVIIQKNKPIISQSIQMVSVGGGGGGGGSSAGAAQPVTTTHSSHP